MKEKMFAGYPDVVNVDQLREILSGIGYKAAYGLLHDGSIRFFMIGNALVQYAVVLAKSSRAA